MAAELGSSLISLSRLTPERLSATKQGRDPPGGPGPRLLFWGKLEHCQLEFVIPCQCLGCGSTYPKCCKGDLRTEAPSRAPSCQGDKNQCREDTSRRGKPGIPIPELCTGQFV